MSQQLILQPNPIVGVDTRLSSGLFALNNYGTATSAMIGTSFNNKNAIFMRGLFRFDVSALPATSAIDSATLTLFNAGSSTEGTASDYIFNAYRVTQTAWTELGASWTRYDGANSWTQAGGDFTTTDHDTFAPHDSTANLVFSNLANLVGDAVAHRGGMLHLLVVGPENDAQISNLNVFLSDATADPSQRPQLVVNYTPRPRPRFPLSGGMQELLGTLGG